MAMTWTTIWPEKEGWYWFYGDRDAHGSNKKDFYAVKVHQASTGLIYIANGTFVYPSQAHGFWMPMVVPDTPKVVGYRS